MFDEIRKSTTGVFDKAKLAFSKGEATTGAVTDVEELSQPDRLEELAEYCPQLTFQQRLTGFAISFSLGCTFFFNRQCA